MNSLMTLILLHVRLHKNAKTIYKDKDFSVVNMMTRAINKVSFEFIIIEFRIKVVNIV